MRKSVAKPRLKGSNTNSVHMQEDLKNTPTEELLKKEKALKWILGVMTGFAIVIYVAAIFLTVKGGRNVTTLIICGLAITILLPMQRKNIKAIREEINRR